MFANPEFETMVNRFSLRFRLKELESSFHKHKEDDYIKDRTLTYLVLITQAIMVTIAVGRNFVPDASPMPLKYLLLTYGMYYFGSLCELLICITERFMCLRTAVPFVISFSSSALITYYFDPIPNFRPAYSH